MAKKFGVSAIVGIKKTQAFLITKNLQVRKKANEGLGQAGRFLQNEVKLSISGHRPEPTSVDTGQFLNSVDMIQAEFTVTVLTPLECPKFLEYGTSKIKPRRHFNNSLDRNMHKINDIVASKIKGL